MKKAVVLLSGGIDSAVTSYIAKKEGYELYFLTFRYGQRNDVEIKYSRRMSLSLEGKEHKIFDLDLSQITKSSLLGNDSNLKTIGSIPITYVPARNIIFLSLALSYAESIEAYDIFIGIHGFRGFTVYPDNSPDFIEAFEKVANIGTKASVDSRKFKIRAPIILLSKGEVIRKGMELGVDFSLTISCYNPDEFDQPCGVCDSCKSSRNGFKFAGFADDPRILSKERN